MSPCPLALGPKAGGAGCTPPRGPRGPGAGGRGGWGRAGLSVWGSPGLEAALTLCTCCVTFRRGQPPGLGGSLGRQAVGVNDGRWDTALPLGGREGPWGAGRGPALLILR